MILKINGFCGQDRELLRIVLLSLQFVLIGCLHPNKFLDNSLYS